MSTIGKLFHACGHPVWVSIESGLDEKTRDFFDPDSFFVKASKKQASLQSCCKCHKPLSLDTVRSMEEYIDTIQTGIGRMHIDFSVRIAVEQFLISGDDNRVYTELTELITNCFEGQPKPEMTLTKFIELFTTIETYMSR